MTMDDYRREIKGGGLFVRDGIIEALGSEVDLPDAADEIINTSDCVVMPDGEHSPPFLSKLTRTVPAAQNATLFQWLKTFIPFGLKWDLQRSNAQQSWHSLRWP